jgi:alpha-beta hydrolase superfamily lysophospholipase
VAGTPGPRIDWYDWSGGREAMLRFGPDGGPTVIAALPLFEEGNRTRTAMVDVLRRLAARGVGCVLPDLPGAGESLVATCDATVAMWREAFAAACARVAGPVHVVAWRGGALLDTDAAVASRWYLAPQSGASLVRELTRVRALGSGGEDYAGNALSSTMIDGLAFAELATVGSLRVVRLESDAKAADRKVAGPALWRAAEPGTDAAFQALVADDVADWIASCGV